MTRTHESTSPPRQTNVQITPEQEEKLTALKLQYGTSRSAIIRWALDFALDRQTQWLAKRSPRMSKMRTAVEGEG